MDIVVCLITAAAAYLLGSIPFGYLVGVAKGIDVRTLGSGNIGATNVFRILGKRAGIVVLAADALKGWLAVRILPVVAHGFFFSIAWSDETRDYLRIIAGVVVILGHNYPCWLRFKGGKGIATSAGVLAALVPITCLAGLLTWILVCLVTRYVSVASMVASLVLPVATWLAGYGYRLIIMTAVMSALAIFKHKGNLQRLMNGTESKLGRKPSPPTTGELSP